MTNKDGGEKKKKQNCKKYKFEEEFVRVVDSGSWCDRVKLGCDKNFDKDLPQSEKSNIEKKILYVREWRI